MEKEKLTLSQMIIAVAGIALFAALLNIQAGTARQTPQTTQNHANFEDVVLPPEGMILPVKWNDIGAKMVEAGVIDKEKFESIYAKRGGLNKEERELLYGENNGNLQINKQNAGYLLNLLWAFGLSNKNPILEDGPMMDFKYGGADRFASTGGWSLANGDVMDHYGKHAFITLTEDQQALVEKASKNIYRPCCGNSTYFPDCNHGMAMLGLLELLAHYGADEEEMYRIALLANSYWFPSTYVTIARYFEDKGVLWSDADPKEILGPDYSSLSGYRRVLEEMEPVQSGGGASCGV